jgi:hypothetical protein
MRKQFKALEHHADGSAQCRDIGDAGREAEIADLDLAGIDGLKPVDRLDQGAFAGTGGPADHHHFAASDLGGAVLEDLECAVGFRHLVDRDHHLAP